MDREMFGTEITLPSRGLPYKDAIPEGRVSVSPMRTTEEKVLQGSSTGSIVQAIDLIISRCVPAVSNSVGADHLVLGDRFYLLNVVRAVSYGQEYTFQVNCESCNQRFKHTVQIPDDFEIQELKEDWKEPFYVELPLSKLKVGLKLLRGTDERSISKYVDRIYAKVDTRDASQKLAGDPAYSFRLATHMVSMEGPEQTFDRDNTPDFQSKAMSLVEQMYARDAQAIRQAVADNDCGPNIEMNLECPKCRTGFATVMPYQLEFFRPGARRGM